MKMRMSVYITRYGIVFIKRVHKNESLLLDSINARNQKHKFNKVQGANRVDFLSPFNFGEGY